VDGVTGISPGGEVLQPSRSDRRRRRGVVLVLVGGVVLLVGATAADSLSLFWVILWTVTSFILIFGGLRDVLHRG
jgi:fatty acid desaturase